MSTRLRKNRKLAIIIPAYNAAQTLVSTVERIPSRAWDNTAKVIIINDGSTDATSGAAQLLADVHDCVEVVENGRNLGYGEAVREGMKLALKTEADYVACLHADGQYPAEYLNAFFGHMMDRGIDVLQGSRHLNGTALAGGMPYLEYATCKLLNGLENLTFGLKMTDHHSGFMLYSRRAIEAVPLDELSRYFDYDLEFIASASCRDLVIDELGIPTRYGDEVSHSNSLRYAWRALRIVGKHLLGQYKPTASPAVEYQTQ